jgi:hypothetical protein
MTWKERLQRCREAVARAKKDERVALLNYISASNLAARTNSTDATKMAVHAALVSLYHAYILTATAEEDFAQAKKTLINAFLALPSTKRRTSDLRRKFSAVCSAMVAAQDKRKKSEAMLSSLLESRMLRSTGIFCSCFHSMLRLLLLPVYHSRCFSYCFRCEGQETENNYAYR